MFITFSDANDALVECELGAKTYYVVMSWNQFAGRWTFSLRDLDGELLVTGAVVENHPLLARIRRPEMPDGELVAWTKPGGRIGRGSFADGTALLEYLPYAPL